MPSNNSQSTAGVDSAACAVKAVSVELGGAPLQVVIELAIGGNANADAVSERVSVCVVFVVWWSAVERILLSVLGQEGNVGNVESVNVEVGASDNGEVEGAAFVNVPVDDLWPVREKAVGSVRGEEGNVGKVEEPNGVVVVEGEAGRVS